MTEGPIIIVDDDRDDREIYSQSISAIGIPNETGFFENVRHRPEMP